MKKFIYILLAVVLIFGGFTVFHYISIPEKTIVFDYNDSAYQLNTKKLLHKKITVDGYDKIAQVTPTDNGFFCFAENSNGQFFVRVKNSATDFVKIPENDILYVEDM